MGWVEVHLDLPNHPSVLLAGPMAGWLMVKSACMAARYRTDGIIPAGVLSRAERKIAAALCHEGLWQEVEGGYRCDTNTLVRIHCHRKAVPADVRRAVYERDGRICQECGSESFVSLDHIRPVSKGGSDREVNLRVLCRSCNSRKGARFDG